MKTLLEPVRAVVIQAGKTLLDGYADTARPKNKAEMAAVPSTFPLLDLAAGHVDAYWQYEVTDLRGESWVPGHSDILAAAPGVHQELLALLQAEGAR